MNLDILFLGKLFPVDIEAQVKKNMKTGMQDAGNALQWNIINGLDSNDCGTIKILDYLPVDSYPKGYTERHIEEHVFQHTDKYRSDDKVVGCTNLTIVKQFVNRKPFKREINRWLAVDNSRQKVVIVYTASTIFLELCKYIKKQNKDILICCIIADIPEFLSARKLTGLEKVFNDYEVKKSAALYKYVDRFVLLTEQMADKLKITAPYVIVEGIASSKTMGVDDSVVKQYAGKKYILYTGTLNYQFGISILLEAFAAIADRDIQLIICGAGQAEEEIRERQREDKRIVFLGKLDRKQVIPLQRAATVLVNPRQNNEEFTKYSFPSKTMEYLAAGVPVVAYKLDGIPDEYDEYINYVEENSPESLTAKLVQICQMDESIRQEMGRRGADFVLTQKNCTKQTLRIIQHLSCDEKYVKYISQMTKI